MQPTDHLLPAGFARQVRRRPTAIAVGYGRPPSTFSSHPVDPGLDYATFGTAAAREGLAGAFTEKRPPRFHPDVGS